MGSKPTTTTAFGKHLATLRLGQGLRQVDVAQTIGISQAAYSSWELTGTIPGMDEIKRLAELFKVETDELLQQRPLKERPGPFGKMERLFARASKLPASEQRKLAELVERWIGKET